MINIFTTDGYSSSPRSGPGKVISNLVLGLKNLNLDFKINQPIDNDDKLLFLQSHHLLSTNAPNQKIIGPNICVLPIDDGYVMSQNYKKIIVPSQWVKDLYLKWLPEEKICIWPVGINTDLYTDMSNNEKTIDCLVYFKRRDYSELNSVIEFLKSNNQTYEVIIYGSYHEEYFIDTIKKCRYGIVIDKCESQGIAIEEMMSANLPLLVWDTIIWDDRGGEFAVSATSVPYWNETCGIKFININELDESFRKFNDQLTTFNPRDFILKNLTLERSLKNLISHYQ